MIYFDNAATTYPKPGCVVDAINGFIKHSGGNAGRGGHRLSMAAAEVVYVTAVVAAGGAVVAAGCSGAEP